MTQEREGRPAWGDRAAHISVAGTEGDTSTILEVSDIVRCTRCHRPLHRPEAIQLGMGWRCWAVAA
ncbi:DUF6011 domain-containing protein [uncultured Nocardioides sp.]|uniref:DUF6011 domain-containing protein n=1 Tax=uncultured Nocardioides sp. TaxID=198441 RepID=UPI00344C08BD